MAGAETTLRSQSDDLKKELAEEQVRVDDAKEDRARFLSTVIEQDIKGHLELLEKLKSRDLTLSQPQVMPQKTVREKPYDWQADQPAAVQTTRTARRARAARCERSFRERGVESPRQCSENMEKLVGADPKPETPPASTPSGREAERKHPLRMDSATIKFTDLQFGKNYDPTNG